MGQPSDITIEFLSSLFSIIKDSDRKEYEKPLLRIVRSLYPNKSEDKSDDEIIPLIKELKNKSYSKDQIEKLVSQSKFA